MTRPDTIQPTVSRERLSHELGEAISKLSDRSEWFFWVEDTFISYGRKDGSATVKGSLAEPIDGVPWTPDRWQLIDHLDDKPRICGFDTALPAVKAAVGCRLAAEAKDAAKAVKK